MSIAIASLCHVSTPTGIAAETAYVNCLNKIIVVSRLGFFFVRRYRRISIIVRIKWGKRRLV